MVCIVALILTPEPIWYEYIKRPLKKYPHVDQKGIILFVLSNGAIYSLAYPNTNPTFMTNIGVSVEYAVYLDDIQYLGEQYNRFALGVVLSDVDTILIEAYVNIPNSKLTIISILYLDYGTYMGKPVKDKDLLLLFSRDISTSTTYIFDDILIFRTIHYIDYENSLLTMNYNIQVNNLLTNMVHVSGAEIRAGQDKCPGGNCAYYAIPLDSISSLIF